MGKSKAPKAPTYEELRDKHCPPDVTGKRPHAAITAIASDEEGEETQTFFFRSIGAKRWRELLKAHPPTDDDHAQTEAIGAGRALWSVEGFPRALIQTSCVEPVLSDDDLEEMFHGDTWNDAEITHLFTTAYEVNTKSSVVKK